MIPVVNALRSMDMNSSFDKTDSYKVGAIVNEGILNSERYNFNERFPLIFSEAIVRDNLKLLSKEQHRVTKRYFEQADGDPSEMDNDIAQLDEFLGGWRDEQ
jgi:hypothetical protein